MVDFGKVIKVKATFIEEALGTSSGNPNIHTEFIASKAQNEEKKNEEIEAIERADANELINKSMTIYPIDEDGNPYLYDYQVKGFFKGTCGFLRKVSTSESAKIKNYKKTLDGLLFIEPRKIRLQMPKEEEDTGVCERPLRAETMRGERVALASSESVPAGTIFEFDVRILDKNLEDFVYEALDYGELSGIGQWRNSGKGRFVWDERETIR